MTRESILITGASSGIGQALARHYAETLGKRTVLGLVARRMERLDALAEELRGLGAAVHAFQADVRERERMAEVVRDFDQAAGGVYLAIANAGFSLGDRLHKGDAAPGADVIATNVVGVVNTLLPCIPGMIERGRGHLVAVSSVAGFRGIPGKGAYCASKAAARILMDAYRPVLKQYGIRVTTIAPGWIESELTEKNPYPMPFMMPIEPAVRKIARAIARGRRTYVFPWQMRVASWFMPWLPDWTLPNLGRRKS